MRVTIITIVETVIELVDDPEKSYEQQEADIICRVADHEFEAVTAIHEEAAGISEVIGTSISNTIERDE